MQFFIFIAFVGSTIELKIKTWRTCTVEGHVGAMSAGRPAARPAARSAAGGASSGGETGAADGRRSFAEAARVAALVVAQRVRGAAGERGAPLLVVHGHASRASLSHLNRDSNKKWQKTRKSKKGSNKQS